MALPDQGKQKFATEVALTIALNNLANGSVATSDAVDNSVNLYDEIILETKIDGTAASTAWLDQRIAASIDAGTDYSTWESPYAILPGIDLSVDLQKAHRRFVAPENWKLMVKNVTGAVLAASGNSASYQGINPQIID